MFEETLVCDGCSRVVDGGSRGVTLRTLRDEGDRAFFREGRGDEVRYREAETDAPWGSTRRHLAGSCAGSSVFNDGAPVPASALVLGDKSEPTRPAT